MDKFTFYDSVVDKTLTNIYTICKNRGEIVVEEIDLKNENDLFFLEIIKMANTVFHYKIYFKGSIFKNLYLKYIKKIHGIDLKLWRARANFNVNTVKNFMSSVFTDDETFANIYNEYYRKDR